MEDINKKYGIFTTNQDFANEVIDYYVRLHNCEISKRTKSLTENRVTMLDGTEYIWIKPVDSFCGCRISVGIIDLETCSLEFIRDCVSPICSFADVVFRDSSRLISDDDSYNLVTLIDRLQKINAIKGNIHKIGFSDSEYGWQSIVNIDVDDTLTFSY